MFCLPKEISVPNSLAVSLYLVKEEMVEEVPHTLSDIYVVVYGRETLIHALLRNVEFHDIEVLEKDIH